MTTLLHAIVLAEGSARLARLLAFRETLARCLELSARGEHVVGGGESLECRCRSRGLREIS